MSNNLSQGSRVIKPGSHLRHNGKVTQTGRSRKRKKCLVLVFYVSSVNDIRINIRIKLIFSLRRYDDVGMSLCYKCEPGLSNYCA